MVSGGVLWIVHGYFRFTTRQGPDVAWREDIGYSQILSSGLFLLYNFPGVLALLAFFFGLIAATGLIVRFDPLTTAGLAVVGNGRAPNRPSGQVSLVLILAGVLGIFTLPLRPLLFAVELLPLAIGAAVCALFGVGWILLGVTLRNEPERRNRADSGRTRRR